MMFNSLAPIGGEGGRRPGEGAITRRSEFFHAFGVSGDIPLSCFSIRSEQDIPRQPAAAAPFQGGIWKPSQFKWLQLRPL